MSVCLLSILEGHRYVLYVLLAHAVIIKLTRRREGGFGDERFEEILLSLIKHVT
jgi:hypothetical protein